MWIYENCLHIRYKLWLTNSALVFQLFMRLTYLLTSTEICDYQPKSTNEAMN